LFIVRAREIFESREPTETAAARRDLEKAETRYERAEALLVVERETRVKNTETALDREQAARREIAELKLALVAASDAEQRAEARLTTRAQHQNANQDLTRMGNYPGQNQFISAPHNPAAHGTFELMRQHATRTSALIANQEAMIAELRRELMLAMEADVLGDGQSSFENEPPLELEPAETARRASGASAAAPVPVSVPNVTARVAVLVPPIRSAASDTQEAETEKSEPESPVPPTKEKENPTPAPKETEPETETEKETRVPPDWASAYLDIDATRFAVDAARPKPVPLASSVYSTSNTTKTDWEAAYLDIEATRALASATRAGKEKEIVATVVTEIVQTVNTGTIAETVPEIVETVTEGGESDTANDWLANDSLANDSPDNKNEDASDYSPDKAVARDLMDKLALIGPSGADALLAQNPEARRKIAPGETTDAAQSPETQPMSREEAEAEAEMYRNVSLLR
jgi:hypothetical protein|tara:strand:+ start:3503 stop:4888 length:1386 start_codon:yes stop_codon:yes gene_type:complete